MVLDLPYGPWKKIFSGNWTGYPITMYENPEKHTLTVIFEKKDDKVTGLVLIMNWFYHTKENASKLAETYEGHALILEKYYPTSNVRFFALSSGARYIKPESDEISKTVEEMYGDLEAAHEKIMEMSKAFGITLTELKNAREEYVKKLFSEPILLAGMIVRKATEESVKRVISKVYLGKHLDGKKAEELIQSFAGTIIERNVDRIQHVLVEGCVLSGVSVVLFDETGDYESVGIINKNFDSEAYPELEPMGMPLKNLEVGKDIKINLNYITPDMFREITRIPKREKDYIAKEASEIIDNVLKELEGKINSLNNIEDKILGITDEKKKFHIYRATRIIRLLEKKWPGIFNGETGIADIIGMRVKTLGTIYRIDLRGYEDEIKRLIIYTVVREIYERYKKELASKELKTIIAINNGPKYVPSGEKTPSQNKLCDIFYDAVNYGLGYSIGCEAEIELCSGVIKPMSMKIISVKEDEIAVKESSSRPYRVLLRPPLSSGP